MHDVVALGELLIDFASVSCDEEGYPTMAAHPGGAPANFLATLSRFGARTALLSKVGDDSFGTLLQQTLTKFGIDTRGVVSDESVFTTLAFVTIDQNGERSFSFARKPGADTQLSSHELCLYLIDGCRVFHFGTLSLSQEPVATVTRTAVEYAREKGKLISFDPNLRLPLWEDAYAAKLQMEWGLRHADVVKISDEEVRFLWNLEPEQGAEKLISEYGIKLAYVTCGSDGCIFRSARASGKVPALGGIKVIDTTGAGDIFGGSAMWKLLESGKKPGELSESELYDIVHFASCAAGLSTTRPGGISSVPFYDEVMNRLSQEY